MCKFQQGVFTHFSIHLGPRVFERVATPNSVKVSSRENDLRARTHSLHSNSRSCVLFTLGSPSGMSEV